MNKLKLGGKMLLLVILLLIIQLEIVKKQNNKYSALKVYMNDSVCKSVEVAKYYSN